LSGVSVKARWEMKSAQAKRPDVFKSYSPDPSYSWEPRAL
jgi:hypothetical protein